MKKDCENTRWESLGIDFIKKIKPIFLKNSLLYISHMEKAVEENDYQTIEFYAHKFRGSAATIGAIKIESATLEIEKYSLNDSNKDMMIKKISSLSDLVVAYENCINIHLEESKSNR